jgi:alpha-L-fucosidase
MFTLFPDLIMKTKLQSIALACLGLILGTIGPSASAYTVPSNMQWWADSRFGMFIHFGSYSYLGHGEWAFIHENWTKANYQNQVSAPFNPASFNATTIANAAKNAGMKYIVITAKHHEGFAMWNSNVQSFRDTTGTKEYNLFDYTVFKRDILQELKTACDTAGVKLCFYYSIWDWNHSSQTAVGGATQMASDTARANYITDMKAQLSELITKYNPAVLWFDGDESGWWNASDGQSLYSYLKGLSPNLVINERVKRGNGLGDFDCPEQSVPPAPLSRSWETCATMNGAWGYTASAESSYRSTGTILQEFVTVVSREGNYLLNIGPKGDGTMTAGSQTILNGIGSWMATYSDSIYGTTRSPYSADPSWGRCTKKSGKLYAHVFTWPSNGQLQIPGLNNAITRIYALNNTGTSLGYSLSGGNINVTVPTSAPNANDSVIVVEVSGIPTASGAAPSGVTFYQDTSYGGAASQLLTAGTYTTAQLSAKGVPDNWASSVQIPSGWTVIIYANDNLAGTSWTLTTSNPSFLALNPSANDQMSSCNIQSGGSAAVTFYQNTGYGGTASQTLQKGTYTLSQLAAKGVPNDWASSVKIPAGWTVIMYSDDNFAGTSWTRTSDTSDFTTLSPNANDQMSSCRIQ